MADVAFVFHWPPAVMEGMELGELLRWRDFAVQRHNAFHAGGQSGE